MFDVIYRHRGFVLEESGCGFHSHTHENTHLWVNHLVLEECFVHAKLNGQNIVEKERFGLNSESL